MAREIWTRRDFFRRSAAFGALAVAGPAALAACSKTASTGSGAGGTLDRIKQAGTVKVGIAGEVPFGYTDHGKVTGEAPEVARAVFKSIGVNNVVADQVEFGQLIQALNAGRYDMVAAGMAILPDRCKNAAFSDVDYVTPTAFMVAKGNPKQIHNFEDVKNKGLKIAVLSGTIEQQVSEATGISKGNIQTYDGQPELFEALTANRADCGALTDISLREVLKENPGAPFEVTPGFVPEINGKPQIQAGGFVFRKGEDDLLSAFNTGLRQLQQSGQWLQIVQPFGFTAANKVPANVTTAQLCAG